MICYFHERVQGFSPVVGHFLYLSLQLCWMYQQYFHVLLPKFHGSSLFRGSTASDNDYLNIFPLSNFSKYSSSQLYSNETNLIQFHTVITTQLCMIYVTCNNLGTLFISSCFNQLSFSKLFFWGGEGMIR